MKTKILLICVLFWSCGENGPNEKIGKVGAKDPTPIKKEKKVPVEVIENNLALEFNQWGMNYSSLDLSVETITTDLIKFRRNPENHFSEENFKFFLKAVRKNSSVFRKKIKKRHVDQIITKSRTYFDYCERIKVENIELLETMQKIESRVPHHFSCEKTTKWINEQKSLTLRSDKIQSLLPLRGLLNLEELDFGLKFTQAHLANGNLETSILKTLPKLKKLNLDFSGKINLVEIGKVKTLEWLSIDNLGTQGAKIKSLKGLGNLTNLKYLSLAKNQISRPGPLSNLEKLEWLDLSLNRIGHVRFVNYLVNLRHLDLMNNSINKIDGLKYLEKLEWLNIQYNEVRNYSALKELQKLTTNSKIDYNPVIKKESHCPLMAKSSIVQNFCKILLE